MKKCLPFYDVIYHFVFLFFSTSRINNEIERQKALEKELNCLFIRINPDEKDFNIFKEINKIHRHIKKFLIDKIKKKSVKIKI